MIQVGLRVRMLYYGACASFFVFSWWCLGSCGGTKFFVECYDCTAQGAQQCYQQAAQCTPDLKAFYCYTFYELEEGGEREKGCATDAQLESWLVEPLEGTRECKDTVNGTKVCYCQNDVHVCPPDASSTTSAMTTGYSEHPADATGRFGVTSSSSTIQDSEDSAGDLYDSAEETTSTRSPSIVRKVTAKRMSNSRQRETDGRGGSGGFTRRPATKAASRVEKNSNAVVRDLTSTPGSRNPRLDTSALSSSSSSSLIRSFSTLGFSLFGLCIVILFVIS